MNSETKNSRPTNRSPELDELVSDYQKISAPQSIADGVKRSLRTNSQAATRARFNWPVAAALAAGIAGVVLLMPVLQQPREMIAAGQRVPNLTQIAELNVFKPKKTSVSLGALPSITRPKMPVRPQGLQKPATENQPVNSQLNS